MFIRGFNLAFNILNQAINISKKIYYFLQFLFQNKEVKYYFITKNNQRNYKMFRKSKIVSLIYAGIFLSACGGTDSTIPKETVVEGVSIVNDVNTTIQETPTIINDTNTSADTNQTISPIINEEQNSSIENNQTIQENNISIETNSSTTENPNNTNTDTNQTILPITPIIVPTPINQEQNNTGIETNTTTITPIETNTTVITPVDTNHTLDNNLSTETNTTTVTPIETNTTTETNASIETNTTIMIDGNRISFIIMEDAFDLTNAVLTITQDNLADFSATFPPNIQLEHLRKGTIITVSTEDTNDSYAPFGDNGDWNITIGVNDMINQEGEFIIDSNTPQISIKPNKGQIIGSDALLTNQNLQTIRANRDLKEVGGIALSNIPSFVGLKDSESLLYIEKDNTLWVSDDNAHKVYVMDFTTHEVLKIYDQQMLEASSGLKNISDLESAVYDASNDTVYIFSGSASSTPAIFKLTRDENGTFTLDNNDGLLDFRKLNHELQAAQFIDGEFIVSYQNDLFLYDFQSDTLSDVLFSTTGAQGHIYGMGYEKDGMLWLVTSKNHLIKVDWYNSTVLEDYNMADNNSSVTYNGVYDTRGLEIINDQIYILEGINNGVSTKGEVTAPYGNALKNAIHIYQIP